MSFSTHKTEFDTVKTGGVGHLPLKTRKEQEHIFEGLSTSLRILASSLLEKKTEENLSSYVRDNSLGNKNVSVSSNRRVPPIAIYKVAPNLDSIDLLSLQSSIIERLSILRFLHTCHKETVITEDFLCRQLLIKLEQAGFFVRYPSTDEDIQVASQYDRLSHFFLRLAFSQDAIARDWFIEQEAKLLQAKIFMQKLKNGNLSPNLLVTRDKSAKKLDMYKLVLDLFGIDYMFIHYDPKKTVERKLWEHVFSTFPQQRLTTIIRMPWWPHLSNAVKRHQCYLEDGYGYISVDELPNVIVGTFRRFLMYSFQKLENQAYLVKSVAFLDPHLGPLLTSVAECRFQQNSPNISTVNSNTITIQNIDQLSMQCFPPCMKYLYLNLKKHKHLKHWGRLQLWLFLKACGMTLDSQLAWWRSVWMNPQQFDKEIKYNLRHAYGLEGKRADYPSFSCSKIISGNPSPGPNEYHGCPFHHFDAQPLKNFLLKYYTVTARDVDGILLQKSTNQFQLACRELFQCTHTGSTADNIGNHPDVYFQDSYKFAVKAQKLSSAQNVSS
ncbi:DNA primase large subunit-like [Hylaeus volcanicus]|uniref:DNA primase large subunit-like n=1 Tax=Hylaeus volcanicus TaxID=313075 RepID=UPI0023B866F2|nr:DNA primase large subunit-like [Hylaeus volcanicus]